MCNQTIDPISQALRMWLAAFYMKSAPRQKSFPSCGSLCMQGLPFTWKCLTLPRALAALWPMSSE